MRGDRRGDPAHLGQGAQQQVHRNPQISHMQHPYQRRAQRFPGLPQRPAAEMRCGAQPGQRHQPQAAQPQAVGQQQRQGAAQRCLFQPGAFGGAGPGNAVGEHRNHPPAHHRHDEQHHIERHLDADPAGQLGHAQLRQVYAQDGGGHQHQEADEKVVAFVARGNERNRQPHGCCQRKSDIDNGRRPAERREHQHPPGHPERGQRHQRQAGGRGPARPVASGGEQKSYDHRQREAEQHFMRMPHRSGQVGLAQPASELQRPQADGQGGKNAGQQVKRPEAQLPQSKSGRGRHWRRRGGVDLEGL